MAKNVYIAVILSLLLTGLGNVYNGLTKRGIVEFLIAFILGLFSRRVHWILGLFAFAFILYALYDTYDCATAINENKRIPLFLDKYDIE